MVIAVSAAGLFALMWVGVTSRWPWLVAVDNRTLALFHDTGIRHPEWVAFWRLVSDLFSPTALRIVAAVGIAVAVVLRNLRVAAFLTTTVMLSGLVTVASKAVANRPRPDTALMQASSSSFPSGHALGITVGVLAFGAVLWPALAGSMRVALVAAGVALIGLVGLSRVVLNVHHPSDVVAGWALGLLYFLLCVAVVQPGRRP